VSGHHHHDHTGSAHDGGPAHDEDSWDELYRSSSHIWSGRPNPQLVAEMAAVAPGRALDVGCGEGADAVWLARGGWEVVATDISSVALGRAARHAREAGPAVAARIEWRHVDLLAHPPEPESFDLVSAQFMQLPPEPRNRLFAALAASVRAGGTLLVVGHHPSHLPAGAERPPEPDRFYAADEIAGLLDASWTVVVNEARPRTATTAAGVDATVHDAVLLATRA
jgi:SAM-dependent methyltransferase